MDGNGRGGCCIARYVGPTSHDMSKVDLIMLRFRPIAPKPTVSSGSGSADSTPEKYEVAGRTTGRGKRKCVKRCGNRRKKSVVTNDDVAATATTTTTTLPLLPEMPDCVRREGRNAPVWLSFGGVKSGEDLTTAAAVVAVPQAVRMVASSVTVERVAEITWGEELGCTDEERRTNLERETCPGFISDGEGKVTWTNEAYREMVVGGGTAEEAVRVWLEMKETVEERWPAFTCRVKVQYRRGGKERSSLTAPCDAWRMDGGGFAWRLDVKAALSLGLGL